MPRLASLFLPDLAIDRIRRSERIAFGRPDPAQSPLSHGERVGVRGYGVGELSQAPNTLTQPSPSRERALVTAHREGQRIVLAAVSPQARALGLAPEMPLTQARILVPGLDVRDSDAEGDSAWLERFGLFAARRWSPRAAVSGPDGLWLDLSGVAHLFGGEKAMCRRILAFCERLGFAARIAVAGTVGAAYALARFGGGPLIRCPSGGEAEAIADFPLAALRLGEEALAAARRLGLERIGEPIAMPRAPLQRRFGAAFLTRLDQALGRMPEPFDPIVPEEPPSVTLGFLEPVATPEAIAEAAAEAVRRLVAKLARSGLGARRLLLLCERLDRDVQQLVLGLARATRDGDHLRRLLCAKIEKIEPGFGIERIRLVASRVEPLGAEPIEGELAGEKPAPDLAPLIDRLAARLGARRLYRLGAIESDLPERSVRRSGPLADVAGWPGWPRPVRLLSPPEPLDRVMALLPDGPPRRFVWRGRTYAVRAGDGPERLYGEWWKRACEADSVRDYFQVEDEEGRRFWLFRRGDPAVPGTGDLSWYLHGVFA